MCHVCASLCVANRRPSWRTWSLMFPWSLISCFPVHMRRSSLGSRRVREHASLFFFLLCSYLLILFLVNYLINICLFCVFPSWLLNPEGVYAWIGINFVLGRFDHADEGECEDLILTLMIV